MARRESPFNGTSGRSGDGAYFCILHRRQVGPSNGTLTLLLHLHWRLRMLGQPHHRLTHAYGYE
jgi:hypothetical protein